MVGMIPSAFAQQRITGKVTDQGGAPVIGAAVMVRGTTNGAVTEADGTY
ncbi:MAG: carboxypeptidase-like regulatory domain-containing protein, partial [Bacteroidales bacterium]|nr:carboxypeptidase-like regulatory domain-containing protein [Bacteroidales bacterium]